MYLPIDTSSGMPIYRQIVNGLKYHIASRMLRPGEKVPSVRELCTELKVNPATVNKAYRELEGQGYLETRRGLGTFVPDPPPAPGALEAEEVLAQKLDELVTLAATLGLDTEELLRIVERRAEKLNSERTRKADGART